MRLQRALARAGVASRRRSEALISAGRVTVNGEVAQIGQTVDVAKDELRVDGKVVRMPTAEPVWLALNKPPVSVERRAVSELRIGNGNRTGRASEAKPN